MEGFRHGFGIYTFADGTKYECNWCHGVREGRCKLTFTNGAVFLGDFQAGELQNVGHYIFSSGMTVSYTGEFHCGEFSGYGEYDYVDGSHCCGHFEHGYCKYASTGYNCSASTEEPQSIARYLNDNSICQPGCKPRVVQETTSSQPTTLASKLYTFLQLKKK